MVESNAELWYTAGGQPKWDLQGLPEANLGVLQGFFPHVELNDLESSLNLSSISYNSECWMVKDVFIFLQSKKEIYLQEGKGEEISGAMPQIGGRCHTFYEGLYRLMKNTSISVE